MNRIYLALGLAFFWSMVGCTMQKRSLMPGWHIETLGHASESNPREQAHLSPHRDASVQLNATACELKLPLEKQAQPRSPLLHDALIPTKSLMSESEMDKLEPLLLPAHEPHFAAFSDTTVAASGAFGETNNAVTVTMVPKRHTAERIGLFLLGIPAALIGSILSLIGLAIGDFELFLLSLTILIAGILAILKASTPDWKWDAQKKGMDFKSTTSTWNSTQVKNPEPSPSSESAEEREQTERLRREALEREQARQEKANQERKAELEQQRAERQRIKATEKQARKVRFQEFINAPMTKIIVGFTIIIIGGLLLS
jgi:hypothetical protein